jgi:peptidoglycan/LPS O-acetylase OafA/YrhL
MTLGELALILAAIVLVSIILYASGALVSRDWSVSNSYILRVLVTAIIAVLIIPIFRDAAGEFRMDELGLLVAFVLLIIAIRFLIVDELTVADDWLASIVIALVAVVLIYVVDKVADEIFDIRLLAMF